MISIDFYVLGFIKENFVSIGLFLMLLKGLSQISSWTWDEKFVQIFVGMFNTVRPNKTKDSD